MVEIGSGAKREVDDLKLSRFACYLIVQNADSSVTATITERISNSWPWYISRGSGLLASLFVVLLIFSGIGLVTGQTYKYIEPLKAWEVHRTLGIILVALVFVLWRLVPRARHLGWTVALGLVIAGILGNLTDRLFRPPGFLHGHVVFAPVVAQKAGAPQVGGQ